MGGPKAPPNAPQASRSEASERVALAPPPHHREGARYFQPGICPRVSTLEAL